MSWIDIENAMQFAVVRASGFPTDRVIWSYQNFNQPDFDHIVITFGGASTVGIDRLVGNQNLSRPNGQEFQMTVKGVREVPFDIEVFTSEVLGDSAARHVLELVRTRLRLPDIRYPLRKVGLVPFDPGPVNWIPYIPNADFRGRATCTVRCYVPVMDCFEYAGYIARITGTIRPTGWGPTGYGVSGSSGLIHFDSNNTP